MNANIKRTPRRRKDVPPSTPFNELPLSGANTDDETDVGAPSHSTPQPPRKSGEALPAAGQSVSADEPSPAPGSEVVPTSAPAATAHVLSAPSNEGAAPVTVGADSSKALTVPERAKLLLKSEQTEKDLRVLLEDSQRVTVITNADGRAQAHAILMRHVRSRTALDDADKVAREDMIALTKGVIEEKKRLATINAEEEKRIRELRDAFDKKIEDEKRARADAEQRRKDAIEARIEEIRNRAADAIGKTSVEIAALIEQTTAVAIDDTFAEFKSRAESVQKMTLDKLRYFHQNAVAVEEKARELAEQEMRLAAERAEIARQREAEELRQAQGRERLAEEQRQAKRAADAEAERQAEQLRRQREEQEAEAARIKAAQDARDAEAVEQQRLQDEETERARQRNEIALQEINAIHHQLLIADVGRAPYCKGGDIESYDWVIGQTEQWPITQEKFGVLTGSAQKVKDSTLASLRKGRADLVRRLQDDAEARAERDRLADESRRLNEQKREQERQEQEAERVRKLREDRIGGINFIRAIVGMSGSLTTLAELDAVIADAAALVTSVDAFGDLAQEATTARDSTLDILQGRREILADRLELEAAAAISRETVAPPTDPVEATDGELLSSATLFGDMARAELPPEPDAPSVDDAIITTLDALTLNYNLDDVRGRELIVRMGQRVAELAA